MFLITIVCVCGLEISNKAGRKTDLVSFWIVCEEVRGSLYSGWPQCLHGSGYLDPWLMSITQPSIEADE